MRAKAVTVNWRENVATFTRLSNPRTYHLTRSSRDRLCRYLWHEGTTVERRVAEYIARRLHWALDDLRRLEPEQYTQAHITYDNITESLNDIIEAAPEIWNAYQQVSQEEAN